MDYSERAAADEARATAAREQINAIIAPNLPPTPSDPACDNGSVARCCYAYVTGLEVASKQGKDRSDCLARAAMAYCNAMPPLTGADNIRDFIACVAHGLLIQAIDQQNSTKLLYAAQVAYSAHKTHEKPNRPGRPYA